MASGGGQYSPPPVVPSPQQAIVQQLAHWVAGGVLALALVGATLAFGGVMAWTWAAMAVAVILAAAALIAGGWQAGVLEWERGPALLCAGIVAAVVALQQVPLPHGVVRAVSPRTEQVFALALPDFAAGERWLPLAYDRAGALEAALKGFTYLLAFLVARRVGRVPAQARALVLLLLGLGCFEAFYGLIEQFAGEGRIFGWQKPATAEKGRASGTFVNPNHFAGFLAMAASVGLALLLMRPRREGPQAVGLAPGQRLVMALTDPGAPKLLLTVLAVLVALAGLAGSGSRGGLLGFAAGGAAATLFAWRRGHARARTLVLLALVGGLVLWVAADGLGRLAGRLDLESLGQEGTTEAPSRLLFTKVTLAMAWDHTLVGVGVGSYEPAFLRYLKPPGMIVDWAHDDYAQLLAELGVVGFTALLVGLVLVARDVLGARPHGSQGEERRLLARMALAGVTPLVLHSFVDFNLRLPGTALWAVVLLGIAWGVARPERTLTAPLPPSLPARAAIGLVLLALGILPCWAVVTIARADWVAFPRIERGQGDERAPEVRLEDLERATGLCPWEGRHWAALAGQRYQLAQAVELGAAEAAAERVSRAMTSNEAKARVKSALITARLRTSAALREAQARAEGEAARAVECAPGNKIWLDLRRSLSRS